MTDRLRYAITQTKLDKMLRAVVDKHPNIFRVELQVNQNSLTNMQMSDVAEGAKADLREMVDGIQSGPKTPPTLH